MRTAAVLIFLVGSLGFLTSASAGERDGRAFNRYGLSAAEIKAMPICERPQRIGHFYGRWYRWAHCGKPFFPGR